MKRTLVGALVGALGGTFFGFALGIFIYPFWFLRDIAMERLDDVAARTEVARGVFIHVNRADPIHWGRGRVSLLRDPSGDTVVYLHDTFEVGPGPRFHVYLVDHVDVRSGGDFLASRRVDLGRLRAFKGSQIYPVPGDVVPDSYKSVVIWCKEFGVLISPAKLEKTLSMREHGPAQEYRLAIAGHVPARFSPRL